MMLIQRVLLSSLLSLVPMALAQTAVEIGYRTQHIHIGNLSEPTDLDPQIISTQQDFNLVMGLLEGLTQYDAKDCHPVPAVAERWESSADGLTWTFHLRTNAKWSNGEPVTAHDFVFAYRRMLSAGLGAEYAYMLYNLKNGEAYHTGKLADFAQVGAKAKNDHTLVLSLEYPVPFLPHLVSHVAWYPVHPATIEKFGKIDERGTLWTRPGNYVGNGAFVLTEWTPNQVIRMTKSPTYWDREAVKLNAVSYYPIESSATEEAAFRSGQLHVTAVVPQTKIAVYRQRNPEQLRQDPQLATYFFRLNVRKPPLNDVRVRRALAMTINRRQIVERVAKGGQDPAFHFTPPDTAGYTAETKLSENIPEAKRLLAEAGFPGGRGFPRIELLYNTNDNHRAICEAVQAMWRVNLGVDITLVNQEGKIWNDTMRQGSYQIARMAWVGDYLDPNGFLEIMLSTSGNNQTSWENSEYDRLVAQAARTTDTAERYQLFQRAEKILIEDMPVIPIYFYKRNHLMLPSVKGWYGNLLDLRTLKGVYLEP